MTIDRGVQRVGEAAIARGSSGIPTHGSAFVAMDINTGEIHGLGSYPNFDPSVFTGVLKPSDYKRISSKANGIPIVNRAVASEYAPGSTFKPITSIATLSATQSAIQPCGTASSSAPGRKSWARSPSATMPASAPTRW